MPFLSTAASFFIALQKQWPKSLRGSSSTVGAISPINALPRTQLTSSQTMTDAGMGKPTSLPWAEGTDSQKQLCSRAPGGIRLSQGLCSNHPLCLASSLSLFCPKSLISPGSLASIKHSCRNPQLRSALRELDLRLSACTTWSQIIVVAHDKTFKNTSQFKITAFSTV